MAFPLAHLLPLEQLHERLDERLVSSWPAAEELEGKTPPRRGWSDGRGGGRPGSPERSFVTFRRPPPRPRRCPAEPAARVSAEGLLCSSITDAHSQEGAAPRTPPEGEGTSGRIPSRPSFARWSRSGRAGRALRGEPPVVLAALPMVSRAGDRSVKARCALRP